MTKVNEEDMKRLYAHLSVQSILDIKENFKEVSMRVMNKLNETCMSSFCVKVDTDIACCCFVFDAGDVYNFLVYPTTRFNKHKDVVRQVVKEQLNFLQEKEINSIIYSGANQVLSVMYSVGFIPTKKVRNYKVLELIKNG